MAFWRKDGKGKEVQDPQALVGRREYDKAIRAYRTLLAAQPGNYNLNHRIADVLCLAGRERDSLQDYSVAAGGYAREGFLIKAIAILKKMQRIAPGDASVQKRLADLRAAEAPSGERAAVTSPGRRAPEGAAGREMTFDMEAEERPPIPVSPAPVPATPLFSGFTPEEMREVVARLRHREFPAGSPLVREGDPGDSLFILSEGRVKVATRGPGGEAVDLAELREGDFFGEVSLLTGKPRTATITSITPTEVLELTREDLRALEERHPRIRDVIQEFYERRVEATVEAMVSAVRSRKPPAGSR